MRKVLGKIEQEMKNIKDNWDKNILLQLLDKPQLVYQSDVEIEKTKDLEKFEQNFDDLFAVSLEMEASTS